MFHIKIYYKPYLAQLQESQIQQSKKKKKESKYLKGYNFLVRPFCLLDGKLRNGDRNLCRIISVFYNLYK